MLATGRQMASGEGDSCPVRYQCVTSALLSALLSALPSALPLSIMGVLKMSVPRQLGRNLLEIPFITQRLRFDNPIILRGNALGNALSNALSNALVTHW